MSTVTTYELAVHLARTGIPSRRLKSILGKHGLKHETPRAARAAALAILAERVTDEIEYINISKVSCTSLGVLM